MTDSTETGADEDRWVVYVRDDSGRPAYFVDVASSEADAKTIAKQWVDDFHTGEKEPPEDYDGVSYQRTTNCGQFTTAEDATLSEERVRPDEYSIGPLKNSTWLTIYEMLSTAAYNEDGVFEDEYEEARQKFLKAHPPDAIRDPEEAWSDSMKEAWNETVRDEIDDL